jgi:hypothetical protein
MEDDEDINAEMVDNRGDEDYTTFTHLRFLPEHLITQIWEKRSMFLSSSCKVRFAFLTVKRLARTGSPSRFVNALKSRSPASGHDWLLRDCSRRIVVKALSRRLASMPVWSIRILTCSV